MKKSDKQWRKSILFFLAGQAASLFGSSVAYYAIIWHITINTGSGVIMTMFLLAATIPTVLMSPIGGVLADRFNRRWLINIADGVIALVTAVIIIMYGLGVENYWLLLVCIAVRAFGQGIQTPAVGSIIPQIVPRSKLARYNGLNGTVQMISMLFAPMAAAVLITFLPVQHILLIDIITATISIIILFALVKVNNPPGAKSDTKYMDEFKNGVKYVAKSNFLKTFFCLSAFFAIIMTPVATLIPLDVTRDFGGDAWKLGAAEIAFVVGGLIGSVIISIWGGFKKKKYTLVLVAAVFGLATIALGITQNIWVYIAILVISGIMGGFFNPVANTLLQTHSDEKYMGRVYGVQTIIFSTAMPIGLIIFGPMADVVLIDWIFIVTGVAMTLSALLFTTKKLD